MLQIPHYLMWIFNTWTLYNLLVKFVILLKRKFLDNCNWLDFTKHNAMCRCLGRHLYASGARGQRAQDFAFKTDIFGVGVMV